MDQEIIKLPKLINWLLQEIPIDYIEIVCLITTLATTVLTVDCVIAIRRRGEILTLRGVVIILNLITSLFTIIMANYLFFEEQHVDLRILYFVIYLFVVLHLLCGTLLIRNL